ncbi:metal-dependent hydrolase [Sinimarinibacterium flocculans]|uniref:metal-dependent hydrolase n=1 Tax=Sinimarinibacterium flocculans TaxID=985250 RepID=UPI00248F9091|nr:metal-dependent hydrolase [Sinimarinibacterium flocculans]
MIPIRRNLHFRLRPHDLGHWHAQGPYVTHFINAMSLFFPEGERYFIHSVRHYRDRIADPALQTAVTAFIGQEAMHGREHEDYNRLLAQAGLPAKELEAHAARFLDLLKARLPAAAQLSVTIAQEHFTAIMAQLVLTDPRLTAGADKRLAALWRWHALEEIEHKAVAFDVYRTVMGRGAAAYVLRSGSMLLTTVGFLGLVLFYQQQLLKADPQVRGAQGFGRFLDFLFRTPGLLPRLALPWLAYFRPGFHPWDHDNRHLLTQMSAVVTQAQRPVLQAA